MSKPTFTRKSITSIQQTIVLGTSGLGGVWGPINEQESISTILTALQQGVSAIDTAPSYSEAERILGLALREWKGPRPFLSSKAGRLKSHDAHTTFTDYSSDGLRRSLKSTLALLNVDYLDLLFLHEPQLVQPNAIPDILETFQSFKKEGLVRKLGLGGNMPSYFESYMGGDNFEYISGFLRMNACNLDVFNYDVDFFKKRGVEYFNASVLHFGLLGERFQHYQQYKPGEHHWLRIEDVERANLLKKLSERHEIPLSTLALRYAISIDEADRIVLGAANQSQFDQLWQAVLAGPLPEDLFNEITSMILNHNTTSVITP